jgi:hypothetical protein
MAKMILLHNLWDVHCTVELMFRECVTILVNALSYLLRVPYRPKSFAYPSKLLNPQYYDAIQLFFNMGFLVLCCVARRCF